MADESNATAEARRSLSRLGATVKGAALVSSLTFSEAQRGYLSVVRFDWPGVWLADDLQTAGAWHAENLDPTREAFSNQLWGWFQSYRDAASDGYVNDFSDTGKSVRDFAPTASPTASKELPLVVVALAPFAAMKHRPPDDQNQQHHRAECFQKK